MGQVFLNLTDEQLTAAVVAAGEPAYRAGQLMDWVYRKAVTDAGKMTNIPPVLREAFTFLTSRVVGRSDSSDGTTKLLLEFPDGNRIETVMIPTEKRATACVSTQAGCAMGCSFCASGLAGLQRNLTSGEIIEQILHLQQQAHRKITNVVFMGMGEPLANYQATVRAIHTIISPKRLGLSARHVTVSTVGIPKMIRKLAEEDLPITLAISLHAPNDPLRKQIMPAAENYPLEHVISAAKEFFASRNREVTLEYMLLEGVNDTGVCADGLAKLAGQLRCNVNIIRYNPVESLPYKRPSENRVRWFAERVSKRGVNVHIRQSRGIDADAACGQLRQRKQDEAAEPQEQQSSQ